jgi:hypothetical protein
MILMGTMTLRHTTQAIENDQPFQLKNLYALDVLSHDFQERDHPNKGDKEVHQFHGDEDSLQWKNTF